MDRGCVPGTNCLVNVPRDSYVAVERFGAFQKVLEPGHTDAIRFAGFDLCGTCISLRKISTQLEEEHCTVTTQTRDHEFITAQVLIQYSVMPKMAKDAIYKLLQQDLAGTLRSFLIGPIRSYLNRYTLEEVFGKKDEMTAALHGQLSDYLKSYGFAIHSLQITELEVSPEVMHALNEATKQRRNMDTARLDMAKLCEAKVREAEAFAVTAELKGQEMSEECQRLIRAVEPSQLLRGFEGAQILKAIEETNAQSLPEDLNVEMLTSLLQDIDSESASVLAKSQAAGLVIGRAGTPSQQEMT